MKQITQEQKLTLQLIAGFVEVLTFAALEERVRVLEEKLQN